jgi:hypothetical protein
MRGGVQRGRLSPTPNNNMNTNNGVSCNDTSGDCKTLLRKLQKIDFSIVDTVLYLNAYPECQKALAYYNQLVCEREKLSRELSQKCRRPITAFDNASAEAWDWISSPWPWEASAN